MGTSFARPFGHPMDMSTGIWYMDGGGSRYCLDDRIRMSPLARLDGSSFLDSANRMEWIAHLGDVACRLDGTRRMGGDGFALDGLVRMGADSMLNTLRISTYKGGQLLEKEVV